MMSVVERVGAAYDCFEKFRNSCDCDKEFRQLIDLFFPMFYEEENNCELTIKVDVLNRTFDNFMVKPGCHGDEPQIILEDRTSRIPRPIMLLNLNAIEELKIETNTENDNYIYDISFRYIDGKNYEIHILMK